MRPKDKAVAKRLDARLHSLHRRNGNLYGIINTESRDSFLEQLIESIHRVEYIKLILTRDICEERSDPTSDLFDPLKAAVVQFRQGQFDEAVWLVFLSVYFGKNLTSNWQLLRDVYGRLGTGSRWNWRAISDDPNEFVTWLAANQRQLRSKVIKRGFGNHRKYESLNAKSKRGTGAALTGYVTKWVRPFGNHKSLFDDAQRRVNTLSLPDEWAFRRVFS